MVVAVSAARGRVSSSSWQQIRRNKARMTLVENCRYTVPRAPAHPCYPSKGSSAVGYR